MRTAHLKTLKSASDVFDALRRVDESTRLNELA
jgi:hypothetical protein